MELFRPDLASRQFFTNIKLRNSASRWLLSQESTGIILGSGVYLPGFHRGDPGSTPGSPCGDISRSVVRFPRQLPFHRCSILTFNYLPPTLDRDSSVGTATRYVLDSPGIQSRWGRDFPHPSRPALGLTQPSVQ
jgi:hypothetical protein